MLPPFIAPDNGRFYPLNGQELNVISVFSTSAFAFYLVNAVELIALALLFFSLTRDITGGRVALAALLLLVFSPGFSESPSHKFIKDYRVFAA